MDALRSRATAVRLHDRLPHPVAGLHHRHRLASSRCLSGLWWRTGPAGLWRLMRFWIRIFALGFGMGVVTGVVLQL